MNAELLPSCAVCIGGTPFHLVKPTDLICVTCWERRNANRAPSAPLPPKPSAASSYPYTKSRQYQIPPKPAGEENT